jgi:hypothetical protein
MKELTTAGDIDSDGTDTIELSIITHNSAITHNGCDHAFTTDEIMLLFYVSSSQPYHKIRELKFDLRGCHKYNNMHLYYEITRSEVRIL